MNSSVRSLFCIVGAFSILSPAWAADEDQLRYQHDQSLNLTLGLGPSNHGTAFRMAGSAGVGSVWFRLFGTSASEGFFGPAWGDLGFLAGYQYLHNRNALRFGAGVGSLGWQEEQESSEITYFGSSTENRHSTAGMLHASYTLQVSRLFLTALTWTGSYAEGTELSTLIFEFGFGLPMNGD